MCARTCVHVSFDSWESISAALVVMETVGTTCMYVCFTGDPQNRAGSRSGQEDQCHIQTRSRLISFLMFVLVRSSETTATLVWLTVWCPRLCVWRSQIGQSAYPGKQPGQRGQAQGHRSHHHLPIPLPSSINYLPSAFHPTIAVPTLITWKQAKTSWQYNVCACRRVCMCAGLSLFLHGNKTFIWPAQYCLSHRHIHTHKHCPPHTHPDPNQPTIPTLLLSLAAWVPILWAPILSPLPDSFWFPFWFLTSGAISGWPAVPLILPVHCVVSWAGPWAPGAGRGARNGLVPVAVLVKGTVAAFPLVHHNCCETDFRAIFVETVTSM